jgi:hypothetical protein
MLFRGKILGEQTNPNKLHWFALKLVKERDNCARFQHARSSEPLTRGTCYTIFLPLCSVNN